MPWTWASPWNTNLPRVILTRYSCLVRNCMCTLAHVVLVQACTTLPCAMYSTSAMMSCPTVVRCAKHHGGFSSSSIPLCIQYAAMVAVMVALIASCVVSFESHPLPGAYYLQGCSIL